MSIFRFILLKLNQKSILNWAIATILIFAVCVMSASQIMEIAATQKMTFLEIYLLSMTFRLNIIFIYSVILLLFVSDAYQNKSEWNRNLLIRSGNRKKWVIAQILYLSVLSAYIVWISLLSYYFSSFILLNPKFFLSNLWISDVAINTFPDLIAWEWSPLKSVCFYSLFLFLRFLFISIVVFNINLSQRKKQLGFLFPLLLGLIEWKFDYLFPFLANYSIMPVDHTILYGKVLSNSGLYQSRVSVPVSLLYWCVLLGLVTLWSFVASNKKDFTVLEDHQ